MRWTQFAVCAIFPGVQTEQVIQGRRLSAQDLALIQTWLAAHPSWSRTELSRQLCLRWGWRNHAGHLKDMACRSLLLKLERQGQIHLPPRRTASVNAARNCIIPAVAHEQSPIVCPLEALQPLQVQALNQDDPALGLFKFLLHRYHYLGHRNCVGENLKYLVRDRSGRPLACLLFGSAAWKLRPRDHWIGWPPEQRRHRLFLLTNNTRFLILPWVRVRHLASHLLGQLTARLSADWSRKYGHPIYLVETFVERERFCGTCYRAAGWLHVGATTGRTRNAPDQKPRAASKEIYLKPLIPELRPTLAA